MKEVRNTFPGINNKVDIIDGSSDDWQRHFDTISSASVIIMSHSTFSWWAAYLNNNPDKIILSPKHTDWFGETYSDHNTIDIIPDSFIQISQI